MYTTETDVLKLYMECFFYTQFVLADAGAIRNGELRRGGMAGRLGQGTPHGSQPRPQGGHDGIQPGVQKTVQD